MVSTCINRLRLKTEPFRDSLSVAMVPSGMSQGFGPPVSDPRSVSSLLLASPRAHACLWALNDPPLFFSCGEDAHFLLPLPIFSSSGTPPAQTVVLGNPLAGFANRPCLLHSTTSGQSKAITLQNHWAFCLIQGLQKVMCHLFLRCHACACAHVTFVPQAAPCYRRGFCSIPVFVSVCLPQE